MQKYLLFTTAAGHCDDDDMISNTGACLIDSFSTIDECIKKAREDLLVEATDVAIDMVDGSDEDEVNDYIQMYLSNTTVFDDLTDADFNYVGASRNIIESEYHSDFWCDSRVYTVVRIS